MITRRGFIASAVAAVPMLAILLSQKNDTNAQVRERTQPSETVRVKPKSKREPIVKPVPATYIYFTYVATRQVTLRPYTIVSDRLLRSLGFVPWTALTFQKGGTMSDTRSPLPPDVYVPLGNHSPRVFNVGDYITLATSFDE